MDDFQEIAGDLIECGGAITVESAAKLEEAVRRILGDMTVHNHMSQAAGSLVGRNSGVVGRHIHELNALLHDGSGAA